MTKKNSKSKKLLSKSQKYFLSIKSLFLKVTKIFHRLKSCFQKVKPLIPMSKSDMLKRRRSIPIPRTFLMTETLEMFKMVSFYICLLNGRLFQLYCPIYSISSKVHKQKKSSNCHLDLENL